MKRKELINKIQTSFIEETPELCSKIQMSCLNEKQIDNTILTHNSNSQNRSVFKRLAFGLSIFVVLLSGIIIGNNLPNNNVFTINRTIYLDVNPSIEIQLDENNKVYEIVSGNQDASLILENIDLNGVEINTALYAIVGAMYTNGYLNKFNNSILVSVDNHDNPIAILSDLANQINDIFKENHYMQCSIIAQNLDADEELKEKADTYGISIGKMSLINKIINSNSVYDSDDILELVNMSIHELNLIYATLFNSKDNFKDDVMTGKPGGYVEQTKALDIVLENFEINEEDVFWSDVIALYHHKENDKRQMIYLVSLRLNGDETIYRYVVDCRTGEILPDEVIDEWKD